MGLEVEMQWEECRRVGRGNICCARAQAEFYKGRDHVIKPETCDSLIFRYFTFVIAFSQRNTEC